MGLIWPNFVKREAEKIAERRERVAAMVAAFSAPGVAEADAKLATDIAQLGRTWIGLQLAKPETATYHDEVARLHPARRAFVVGRVESQNVTGRPCSNWYIVQFDLVQQEADGAVLDERPEYVETLAPLSVLSGTQLPYANAALPDVPQKPKPTYLAFNLWLAFAIAIIFFLILGIVQLT